MTRRRCLRIPRRRYRTRRLIAAHRLGTRRVVDWLGCEIDVGRAVDHLPMGAEARSVAWTIPSALGFIPLDDATQVRTRRAVRMQRAGVVTVHRDLVQAAAQDRAAAAGNLVRARGLAGGEPRGVLRGDVGI